MTVLPELSDAFALGARKDRHLMNDLIKTFKIISDYIELNLTHCIINKGKAV